MPKGKSVDEMFDMRIAERGIRRANMMLRMEELLENNCGGQLIYLIFNFAAESPALVHLHELYCRDRLDQLRMVDPLDAIDELIEDARDGWHPQKEMFDAEQLTYEMVSIMRRWMKSPNPEPAKWVKQAFEEAGVEKFDVGVVDGGLDERDMFESNPYRQLMEKRTLQ